MKSLLKILSIPPHKTVMSGLFEFVFTHSYSVYDFYNHNPLVSYASMINHAFRKRGEKGPMCSIKCSERSARLSIRREKNKM